MKDYIQQAIKTEAIEVHPVDPRLTHACIGICTEIVEVLTSRTEEEALEEAGDVLWYCAVAADALQCTFDELMSLGEIKDENPIYDVTVAAGEALDQIKKVFFYGVALDGVKLAKFIGTVLLGIYELNGGTLEDLQEANIAKLRARYGEKFDPEVAQSQA